MFIECLFLALEYKIKKAETSTVLHAVISLRPRTARGSQNEYLLKEERKDEGMGEWAGLVNVIQVQ